MLDLGCGRGEVSLQAAIDKQAETIVHESRQAAAKAAWLAKTQPAWGPPAGAVGSVASTSVAAAPAPAIDESAAKAAWLAKSKPPSWGPGGGQSAAESAEFVHAPVSYFALDKLASKGTRRAGGSLVDVGEPEDWSRPIAKTAWNGARAGSWACSEGAYLACARLLHWTPQPGAGRTRHFSLSSAVQH